MCTYCIHILYRISKRKIPVYKCTIQDLTTRYVFVYTYVHMCGIDDVLYK